MFRVSRVTRGWLLATRGDADATSGHGLFAHNHLEATRRRLILRNVL